MNTDDREYYALWYRLDAADRFLLWYSADVDGVWTTEGGAVRVWASRQDVRSFAFAEGLPWNDESPKCHDLDIIESFVSELSVPSSTQALDAWNLFTDVARSVQDSTFLEEDDRNLPTYDSLFHACGVLPDEKERPLQDVLGHEALRALRDVLRAGLRVFRRVTAA